MKKYIAMLAFTALFAGTMTAEVTVSGKSFLRLESPFQSASPERVALAAHHAAQQQKDSDRCGNIQFTVFGGRNAKRAEAAAYYMPGGHQTLTFSGKVSDTLQQLFYTGPTLGAFVEQGAGYDLGYGDAGDDGQGSPNVTALAVGADAADNLIFKNGANAATAIAANDPADLLDPAANTANALGIEAGGTVLNDDQSATKNLIIGTGQVRNIALTTHPYQMDRNKNTNVIRPWNFGITFATRVHPGLALVEPDFESTITPEFRRLQWGVGAAWRQHLSEDQTGFWLEASTAIQRVKHEMQLNEVEKTAKTFTTSEAANLKDASSIHVAAESAKAQVTVSSWSDQGFPVGDDAPKNVTEAFAQEAWLYGKIDGAQSKTRLADIELKLGYNFVAEENYSSAGYLGFVLPTGNKAEAVYMAEAVVGNGKHFGLMLGSNSHMMLSSDQDMSICFRCDADARYLFRNTQKRSFDVKTNGQWSRYMMVWKDFDAFNSAIDSDGTDNLLRSFTPGINEFTQDMYVTPRAQGRINQALHLESGNFRGELGWNVMLRQSEKVELVDAWDKKVAFADASRVPSSYLNPNRTIYNDSYESVVWKSLDANGEMQDFTSDKDDDETTYNNNIVAADDLDLQSAASPMAFTNTPYISVGYDWEDGYIGLGGSYEFSKDNSYNTSWMLWGKLGFSF